MAFRFLTLSLVCSVFLYADEEASVTDQMQSSLYQTMDFSDVKITTGKNISDHPDKEG